MTAYYRPLPQTGPTRPPGARALAGGWTWFTHAERLCRETAPETAPEIVPAERIPEPVLARLTAPRGPIAGLAMDRPRLMGILNTTPDSFSDGGRFLDPRSASEHAGAMIARGADIIDVGGESTRPGATPVPAAEEIARTRPVIAAIRAAHDVAISIDTRKSPVADAALKAGAGMLNDVSALTHDPDMAETARRSGVPICLMHARGEPETMQDDPRYDHVLLDVYDHLAKRIAAATAAGIRREHIVIDPGIGFGKTLAHNLALLRRLSLFHALGCPILLGCSRKRLIATLSGAEDPDSRLPGSLALALAGIAQGVQIARVHDIAQTKQALTLWGAATGMGQTE